MDKRSRTNDPLLGKMWKTKSARFNANARLSAKHSLSNYGTAILAVYIIVATIAPLEFQQLSSGDAERLISMFIIAVSMVLIVISLQENARNYQGQADRMHRCALEISTLYNRFQALTTEEADTQRVKFSETYSQILVLHDINHKQIDAVRFQLSAGPELGIRGGRYALTLIYYFFLWLGEYWLYGLLMVAPPLLLLICHGLFGF